MDKLANKYADYAPGRFLKEDYRVMKMVEPLLLRNIPCIV